MNWLHIGTSPSVVKYLPVAKSEWQIDKVATCNRGLLIEPQPDVYVACDAYACVRFASLASKAQKRGTKCVTMYRKSRDAQERRNVEWYDEFLSLPPHGLSTRESYGAFRYTGPLTVEYAIRHGARRVILVGCDGYKPTEGPDYFDEESVRKSDGDRQVIHQRRTVEVLQPAFQHIANTWPDVQFVRYGEPCFTINAVNWEDRK